MKCRFIVVFLPRNGIYSVRKLFKIESLWHFLNCLTSHLSDRGFQDTNLTHYNHIKILRGG